MPKGSMFATLFSGRRPTKEEAEKEVEAYYEREYKAGRAPKPLKFPKNVPYEEKAELKNC